MILKTARTWVFLLALFFSPSITQQLPNIIFIMVDDMGYGDIGALWQNSRSANQIKTPEMDKMISQGTILNRHYTGAPVCAPARSTFISGMHQGHTNVRNNQFDKAIEDNHNVASTLKSVGYHTSLIGKYGLQGGGSSPDAWAAYPTKRGFDYFYGYVRHGDGHTHYPDNTWPLGKSGNSRNPKQLYENNNDVSSNLDKCYTTDLFTAKAKQIIQDRTTNHATQPFFIFLAYDTPHAALQLPTVAYPNGKGVNGGLQWAGVNDSMINTATGTIDSYRDPLYTGKGWADTRERLATSVTRIDHGVGDIIQTLKDLNIDENTIVIFSSDNGPLSVSYMDENYDPQFFQSYGPFEGIKRDSYEGGIRVPTLVWGPTQVLANQKSELPSQFQDWAATFCDYAGVVWPARLDGVSLKPTLSGKGLQKPGLVYVEYSTGGSLPNYSDFPNHQGTTRKEAQVIYLDGYKGIRNDVTSHSLDFKIFDTKTDLKEANNLAGTTATFTQLQQRMKDRVLQVRMPNPTAVRAYDNEMVPPVNVTDTINGVSVKSYEGDWKWVPKFELITAINSTHGTSIELTHLTRPNNSGLLFSGFISVPTTGTWTFYSTASKGSIFKLHDKLVLDADFKYNGSEISQTVNLEAGLHPFRLYFRTETEAPSLGFQWAGPSVSKQAIPSGNLFVSNSSTPVVPQKNLLQNKGKEKGRTIDGKRREVNTPKPWGSILF